MEPLTEGLLPPERHCALFDTALGPCGIAWRGEAVAQVQLPTAAREITLTKIEWESGSKEAPPPWPAFIVLAMQGMQALLNGEPADAVNLQDVPLDWAGIGHFERQVYEATRRLPAGRTCTYEELARTMGQPGATRAVDVALGRNPWSLIVPCHRVLAGAGKLGGFSGAGGVATKRRLLDLEAAIHRAAR